MGIKGAGSQSRRMEATPGKIWSANMETNVRVRPITPSVVVVMRLRVDMGRSQENRIKKEKNRRFMYSGNLISGDIVA